MSAESLRSRQSSLARTAIFEALLSHLESGDADDISMEVLATEAGVSRRTLYRYFPTRADLLAAAGDWIRADVLALPIHIGAEGIVGSFRAAASRLERRPELARALLKTQTGRALRTGYRDQRVSAIRDALRREVPGLPPRGVKQAAPVLSYLCSSSAWIAIQDESGVSASSAQAAVVWAIETLLAQLHANNHGTSNGD